TDSQFIDIGDGLEITIEVTDGRLAVNDTFTFRAVANNRIFSVSVDGSSGVEYEMPAASYTSVAAFVTAVNNLIADDYIAVEYETEDGVTVAQFRTNVAGERIQLTGSCGFAA